MRYWVNLKGVDATHPHDQKQFVEMLEKSILPTFDKLTKLEKERRIIGGGVCAGRREISFIVEAKSNEEVGELIHGLPCWRYVSTRITPLESFEFRFEQDRKAIDNFKKNY